MARRQQPGPRRPTIADIANRAGVSKGSVSYALNGRPGVSELTRRRILAIAEEVGWHPTGRLGPCRPPAPVHAGWPWPDRPGPWPTNRSSPSCCRV